MLQVVAEQQVNRGSAVIPYYSLGVWRIKYRNEKYLSIEVACFEHLNSCKYSMLLFKIGLSQRPVIIELDTYSAISEYLEKNGYVHD